MSNIGRAADLKLNMEDIYKSDWIQELLSINMWKPNF